MFDKRKPDSQEGDKVPAVRERGEFSLGNIGNVIGDVDKISGVVKTATEFSKTPIGKYIAKEFLGMSSFQEGNKTKHIRFADKLSAIRNAIILLMITATGCYIAFSWVGSLL